MMNTADLRTTALFLLLPLLGACGIKTHVAVGDRRDSRATVERASPTPEADALFAQRADLAKLKEAVKAYEAWLETESGIVGLTQLSAEDLQEALLEKEWTQEAYLVLDHLAMGYYFLGVSQVRNKAQDSEIYLKARSYAFAALSVVPEFAAGLREGTQLKDLVQYAGIEQIDALHWGASAWTRWGEYKGALTQLKSIPQVLAAYARIAELDPNDYAGVAHRGMGAIYCAVPALFGGDTELGGQHLRRAIEIDPDYLESHVLFAEYYLTATGDRAGYEEAVNTVLNAELVDGPYLLDNRLAQEKAKKLMEDIDRRF